LPPADICEDTANALDAHLLWKIQSLTLLLLTEVVLPSCLDTQAFCLQSQTNLPVENISINMSTDVLNVASSGNAINSVIEF
jgi:hypothetical protein